VIGGSKGIGRAICNALQYDYTVISMARSKSDIVDNIFCDVTQSSIVQNSFQILKEKYGSPYGLIYVSGVVFPESIIELTEESLLQTFQVNTFGAFRCVQEFVKLNKSDGKIILIGSTSGERACPGLSSYGASKASLINFGLSIASELQSYRIKVYIISPGRAATELRKKICINEDQDLIMQPETVGNFVYKLIHDDEGYLSNQNIKIKKY
jgi:3-oxoacyl-[acyl-carrier protein] reductase